MLYIKDVATKPPTKQRKKNTMAKLTKREREIIDTTYNFENPKIQTREEREEFARDMSKVARAALKLRRLFELACNGYPRPKLEYRDGKWFQYDVEDLALRAKCERQEKQLEVKIAKIMYRWGCRWKIQGDPRGPAIYATFGADDSTEDNFTGRHTHLVN